ncbi:MAG: 30S ribosomal protein S11, partial [Planctomycetota bacterium]
STAREAAKGVALRAPLKPTVPAVEKCVAKARRMGMREIEVHVRGAGAGRESSITAFEANGLSVIAIEDHTPVPHNGCRPPKQRRV